MGRVAAQVRRGQFHRRDTVAVRAGGIGLALEARCDAKGELLVFGPCFGHDANTRVVAERPPSAVDQPVRDPVRKAAVCEQSRFEIRKKQEGLGGVVGRECLEGIAVSGVRPGAGEALDFAHCRRVGNESGEGFEHCAVVRVANGEALAGEGVQGAAPRERRLVDAGRELFSRFACLPGGETSDPQVSETLMLLARRSCSFARSCCQFEQCALDRVATRRIAARIAFHDECSEPVGANGRRGCRAGEQQERRRGYGEDSVHAGGVSRYPPRSTCPGSAPVCSFSSSRTSPFTTLAT